MPPSIVKRRISSLVRMWHATDEREALDSAVALLDTALAAWPEAAVGETTPVQSWRLELHGWAGDPTLQRRVESVRLVSDGEEIAAAIPRRSRPDVAEHFSNKSLARSGFRLHSRLADRSSLATIRVVAHCDSGEAIELPFTDEMETYFRDHGLGARLARSKEVEVPDRGALGWVDQIGVWPVPRRGRTPGERLTGAVVADRDWHVIEAARHAGRMELAKRLVETLDSSGGAPHLDLALAYFEAGCDDEASKHLDEWTSHLDRDAVRGVFGLREARSAPFTRVLPSTSVDVSLPAVWGRRQAGEGTVTLGVPELGIEHVGRATIVRGSTVVTGDETYLYDESARPSRGFVAGTWDHVAGTPARVDEALLFAQHRDSVRVPKGILLSGRVDFNHFHFLIEYLPRLRLLEGLSELTDVPIIVTDELGLASREALGLLAPDREVITIRRDQKVSVDDLHIPSMHTMHPDATHIPWIEGCRYSPELLLWTRERLLEHASHERFPSKVFLERSSRVRGLVNVDQVREAIASLGFEPIDPGRLSIRDQIALFSGASVLVGVGGAALANLLFADPDSRCVALVADALNDFCIHAAIATFVGVDFQYVTGPTTTRELDAGFRRDHLHSAFRIDPDRIAAALASAPGD